MAVEKFICSVIIADDDLFSPAYGLDVAHCFTQWIS